MSQNGRMKAAVVASMIHDVLPVVCAKFVKFSNDMIIFLSLTCAYPLLVQMHVAHFCLLSRYQITVHAVANEWTRLCCEIYRCSVFTLVQSGLGLITLQCNRLNYRLLCPKIVIDYN